MLADELAAAATALERHRQSVRALAQMLRFGVLVDSHNAALYIAREIHDTARALEGAGNQLTLLPEERSQEK
jgi:2-C-methyl-D-erythritol 4-phosphate cytidylyltransferase